MKIRIYSKDHLKDLAQPLTVVPASASDDPPEPKNSLRFWTKHDTKKILVDLSVFRDGQSQNPHKGEGGMWSGPFTGRPELITQLAPAMREATEFLGRDTNALFQHSLRVWWRLFDSVEAAADAVGTPIARVRTAADITEIHRQRAFDDGMNRQVFSRFVRLINDARSALGLRQLYWNGPTDKNTTRHLPPQWQTDKIRFALKRGWFNALDHWELAGQVVAHPPIEEEARLSEEEKERRKELMRLRASYQIFDQLVRLTKNPTPSLDDLAGHLGINRTSVVTRGYSLTEMLRGSYPNGSDIRMAFHLCLAYSGWNPAVLLSLNVNEKIIEPHPKDPRRYIMRGFKARGGTEQFTDGLFKSLGSPGTILQTLIKRTEPLREKLRKDLQSRQTELSRLRSQSAEQADIDATLKAIHDMQHGIRSPWLYTEAKSSAGTINWLKDSNYHKLGASKIFLECLISNVNRQQPADQQLAILLAGDFRDAFAAYSYLSTGGSVLSVMRALGHRRPSSTQGYLDNTLINERSQAVFRAFSQSLWDEIKVHGRADPTILAQWSRGGQVTEEHRQRLVDYRGLRRSRMGVGCKDPTHPPKAIDPSFVAQGASMCRVQRCMLCIEHAVIFPDSLPGLVKRLTELRHIKTRMPLQTFNESSFDTELENTELALLGFDPAEVEKHVNHWEQQINRGKHRIIDLEGAYE